jgi:hypothetical protein
MDVFDLDERTLDQYAKFARSFTKIRSREIQDKVDRLYQERRFWPEPLIQLNPHYESGGSIQDLVGEGGLAPECAEIFRDTRVGPNDADHSLKLRRHQAQAIGLALADKSFVVTTGTGSGKSLCYFVPIARGDPRDGGPWGLRRGDRSRRRCRGPGYPLAALEWRFPAGLHRVCRARHSTAARAGARDAAPRPRAAAGAATRVREENAGVPRTTEAERLVVQRVGQDVFRAALMDYWGGRCAVTGCAEPLLLRASHIKPWALCATDAERLDVKNGLLLTAHLDAAFDAGLIDFDDAGQIRFPERFCRPIVSRPVSTTRWRSPSSPPSTAPSSPGAASIY